MLIIYECGICDQCHPWEWDGDCRDDANRFSVDEYLEREGLTDGNIEVRSMNERVEADILGT